MIFEIVMSTSMSTPPVSKKVVSMSPPRFLKKQVRIFTTCCIGSFDHLLSYLTGVRVVGKSSWNERKVGKSEVEKFLFKLKQPIEVRKNRAKLESFI